MQTWPNWQAEVLNGIGAIAGGNGVGLLNAWHACEQSGASFNPLNTTQPWPGATDYNSAGVKNYPSADAGRKATVKTLLNGNYNGIVADLRNGGYTAAAIVSRNASEFSTWGTSVSCLTATTGALPPPSRNPPPNLPRRQPTPAPGAARGTPEPTRAFTGWAALAQALGRTWPTQAKRAEASARAARWAIAGPIRVPKGK